MKPNPLGNPTWIVVVQALLALQTLVWFLFCLGYLTRPSQTTSTTIIALLMFANAAVFLGIAWGVGKRLKTVFYFAILFLALHILLTVADEFGIFDLFVLLADGAILVLLLLTRKFFTQGIAGFGRTKVVNEVEGKS